MGQGAVRLPSTWIVLPLVETPGLNGRSRMRRACRRVFRAPNALILYLGTKGGLGQVCAVLYKYFADSCDALIVSGKAADMEYMTTKYVQTNGEGPAPYSCETARRPWRGLWHHLFGRHRLRVKMR